MSRLPTVSSAPIRTKFPGLSEALQGFPPVPSRWIDPSVVPAWAIPDGFVGLVGSVVVTPLPGLGVPAGALIVFRLRSGCVHCKRRAHGVY